MADPGCVHQWVRRLDVEEKLDNSIYLRHCSKCGLIGAKKRNGDPSSDEGWVIIGYVR